MSTAPGGEASLWAEAGTPRASACRMEWSLPWVGAKGTGSSPVPLLQELRLQRALRGNAAQLRAFLLRSRRLDKQREKSSWSPGVCTVHKDKPGKGFLLAYRGAANTNRAEGVTQEIQSKFRLRRPNPNQSCCCPHLILNPRKPSVYNCRSPATCSNLLAQRSPGASQLVSCCHRGRGN